MYRTYRDHIQPPLTLSTSPSPSHVPLFFLNLHIFESLKAFRGVQGLTLKPKDALDFAPVPHTQWLEWQAAVQLPGALWRSRNAARRREERGSSSWHGEGARSQNAPCINTAAVAAPRSPGGWRSGTRPELSPASRCCGATAAMAESAPARVGRAGRRGGRRGRQRPARGGA